MKKIILLLGILFCFSANAEQLHNKNLPIKQTPTEYKSSLELKLGPSILTQRIAEDADSKIGVIIDGRFLYKVNTNTSLGLDANWESHGVSVADIDLGDVNIGKFHTISLMPVVQYYFSKIDNKVSPYISLAAGININSFSESDIVSLSGFDIKTTNSFGIKPAVGLDFLLTERIALNTEMGWKWNTGTTSTNTTLGSDDFNLSSFQWLFGSKFYF